MDPVETQVIGAVSAVVSAFHGGAELVAHIKKKYKRRKSEQAYKERQLQESLQTGEVQVEQRYAADCRELGAYVKKGDGTFFQQIWSSETNLTGVDIARDRLLHIAVVMQAEVIRSLQLAVKYENAILDLTVLHEASIINRKDTITALDELKQRVLIYLPVQQILTPPYREPRRRPSNESLQSFKTANVAPDTYIPSAVTIPDEHDTKTGLSRYFSSRRSSGRNQVQTQSPKSAPHVSLPAGSGWVHSAIQEQRHGGDIINDINNTLTHFQGLQIDTPRRDTLGQLQGLPAEKEIYTGEHFNRDYYLQNNSNQNAFNRNDSTSTRSAYSDKIPVSTSSTYSTSPDPSNAGYSTRSSLTSPITPSSPIALDAQLSGFNPGYRPVDPNPGPNVNFRPRAPLLPTPPAPPAPPQLSQTPQIPQAPMSPSSSYRSSIMMPFNPQQQHMMVGRPCKDNGYWGFCKGAWATREDLKKGLSVQSRPEGLYNTISIWQCKHCLFQGDTFGGKGKKKNMTVDPNVHVSAVGIRYRWIFLAKSHVKKKSVATNTEKGECSYGCMFCCAEGRGTGIYGNVQTLMNHIFLEHAKGITEDVKEKTRCVVGRTAGPQEQWDINIPFSRFLEDGTAVRDN